MGDGWAGNRFLFRVAFACGLFAGRSLNRPLGDLPDEIAMSTAFGGRKIFAKKEQIFRAQDIRDARPSHEEGEKGDEEGSATSAGLHT